MTSLTLTRQQAADLCNLSPTGFDTWVRRGIVPGPIEGTRRWSRAALERAVSGVVIANDDNSPDAIFERWEKSRAG